MQALHGLCSSRPGSNNFPAELNAQLVIIHFIKEYIVNKIGYCKNKIYVIQNAWRQGDQLSGFNVFIILRI